MVSGGGWMLKTCGARVRGSKPGVSASISEILVFPASKLRYDWKIVIYLSRLVFVKPGCTGGKQIKIWQNSLLTPPPWPQGQVMSVKWEEPIDKLTVQFGDCIINQTLNIALCKRDGITDRRTIRLLDAPADPSGQGHKKRGKIPKTTQSIIMTSIYLAIVRE